MKHLKNFSQTYSQHIPPMSEYFQSLNFDDFQQELSVFVFFVHWFNGGWVSVIKKKGDVTYNSAPIRVHLSQESKDTWVVPVTVNQSNHTPTGLNKQIHSGLWC